MTTQVTLKNYDGCPLCACSIVEAHDDSVREIEVTCWNCNEVTGTGEDIESATSDFERRCEAYLERRWERAYERKIAERYFGG